MRYVLVPFEVPTGVRQLEIRYWYSDRIDSDPLVGGGNTLDIGLFDPRGTATGSAGFRGWSGSHKDAFVVGEDWATPPYAAGPMPAGTWNVLLGPYKVGPRGCDYRVEIRLDPGRLPPDRDLVRTGLPVRPALPPARAGWIRGDLHCHTRYSDGDSWPAEMLHAAVRGRPRVPRRHRPQQRRPSRRVRFGWRRLADRRAGRSRSRPTAGTGTPGEPTAGGSSASQPARPWNARWRRPSPPGRSSASTTPNHSGHPGSTTRSGPPTRSRSGTVRGAG